MARQKRGGGPPSRRPNNNRRTRQIPATVPKPTKRKNTTTRSNTRAKRVKSSPQIDTVPVRPVLPIAPSTSQTDINGDRKYNLRQRVPTHKMEDLVGINETKDDILNSVVRPFAVTKAMAKLLKLSQVKGVLLTGVPGTGKTALADGIVEQINKTGKKVNFFHETGACLSKWVGETESNMRTLFRTAHENAPSVIFFDEIDGLGRARGDPGSPSGSSTTMTTFLTEVNNIEPGRVLLIAATNCPQRCDEALIRKGRFDLTINVKVPDDEGRRNIFLHYLAKKELPLDDESMNTLVNKTIGWTGADVKSYVDSLHVAVINQMFPNGSYVNMTLDRAKTILKQKGKKIDMNKIILHLLQKFKKP